MSSSRPRSRTSPPAAETPKPARTLRTEYILLGRYDCAPNAAKAFTNILTVLEERAPGFIDDRLGGIPAWRGILFTDKEQETLSEAKRRQIRPVTGKWLVNTNLTNARKSELLETACAAAELTWGDPKNGLDVRFVAGD